MLCGRIAGRGGKAQSGLQGRAMSIRRGRKREPPARPMPLATVNPLDMLQAMLEGETIEEPPQQETSPKKAVSRQQADLARRRKRPNGCGGTAKG